MTNEDLKKVAIKASLFALVSISLMLHRSATKHIMITDAASGSIDRGSSDGAYSLLVDGGVPDDKENVLIIPLSRSVSSDDIILEDRYVDHELMIYIDSREEGFYKDNAIVTDLDILDSAMCVEQNETGSVRLDFKMDALYATESSLTDSNTIEVKFYKPSELYDKIVVIDTAKGGSEMGVSDGFNWEKDLCLETALLLKNRALKDTEKNIKFYFTRLSDEDVDAEKRKALIRDSEAGLFVEISAQSSENSADNGVSCFYNDSYFLGKLTNAQFADIMEKKLVTKTGAYAHGIFPSEDDELIDASTIPSVKVSLGYMTGDTDAARLSDNSYRTRLAEGLYEGIAEAFEVME